MAKDFRNALSLYLESSISRAGKDGKWLFANAVPLPDIAHADKQEIVCQQDFRPDFLALMREGYEVDHRLPECLDRFCGAIFLPGRSRRWNEFQVARIWNKLRPGQSLVLAGNKNSGIASLRKWLSGMVDVEESFSKHHSIVFKLVRTESSTDLPVEDIDHISDGYHLSEGVFSADGIDSGSALLAEQFDNRIKGRVADLGAGWGYLSCELVARSSMVSSLDLFEASFPALELARKNLGERTNIQTDFHWIDVTSDFPKKPYDWVIMNPPFHGSGRAADPNIGKRFIEVAASTLPSGGRLLMVANRNLPYERTLDAMFRRFETLTEDNGFKVIEAAK